MGAHAAPRIQLSCTKCVVPCFVLESVSILLHYATIANATIIRSEIVHNH